MPHRVWVERLEDELIRREVPAGYRRRLLTELRDHADDLTDGEGMTMRTEVVLNERLGDPVTLAACAAEEYRRARWASRHPFLVFGALPLPASLLLIVATVLLFGLADYGCGQLMGGVNPLPRPAAVVLAYAQAWGVRLVPFVLLAALFTRLYLRSRVSRWWFATAAVQTLVVAGSFVSSTRYGDEPGQSAWVLGFVWMPIPLGNDWTLPFFNSIGWMQAIQAAVPLLVAVLMFRSGRRRQVTVASVC